MLRWENGTRYYSATLQHDLFGLCVIYSYGAVGNKRGKSRSIPCDSLPHARRELRAIFKKRKKRGYRLFP
jgi:predicted DNA-binding WGR domain protein